MKYKLLITVLIGGNLFSRSGFGYTVGAYSGGKFTLPTENNRVEWIDYNPFFNGSLDYIKNDLGVSIGGRVLFGNLLLKGLEENNDNKDSEGLAVDMLEEIKRPLLEEINRPITMREIMSPEEDDVNAVSERINISFVIMQTNTLMINTK